MFGYKYLALSLAALLAAFYGSQEQSTFLAEDAIAANLDEARELYYDYYYGEYYDDWYYDDWYYDDWYYDDWVYDDWYYGTVDDLEDAFEDAVTGLVAVFIIVPILICVCCGVSIYCCCKKAKKRAESVVVVAQGGQPGATVVQ